MWLTNRKRIAVLLAVGWVFAGLPAAAMSDEGREQYLDAAAPDEVGDPTPRVEVPDDIGADRRDQVPDDIRTDRRQELLAPGEPDEVPDAGERDEVQ